MSYGIDPFTYIHFPQSTAVYAGRTVGNGLDQRAAADKQIKAITANSLDVYASIRSFYLQNRESDITGGKLDIETLPDFGAPTGVKPPSANPAPSTSSGPVADHARRAGGGFAACRSAPCSAGAATHCMTGQRGDLVLVTGATGFLGSAVARVLAGEGFCVRVLARPSSPRGNLAGLALEVVEGDLNDASSLAPAMAGVRHLYHVAADYRLWAKDPEEIVRNNLKGTHAIMQAAQTGGG